jgi:hypothetical protein
MKYILAVFFFFCYQLTYSQDAELIKVHFLYGSKPLKQFRKTEEKWFGGVWGGHVGIEGSDNSILNFVPAGKFHWIASKKDQHSRYAQHSTEEFYALFGGNPDSVKKAIVYIPVTQRQKQRFDSIASVYLKETPYDYAFWGMRCGAAAYEILGQLNIVPSYAHGKTYRKIFYPKRLRKRLFKKATQNDWKIVRQEGTMRRKWEKD